MFQKVTVAHAADAKYPAAGAMYLDLGAFYDTKSLRPYLSDIEKLFASYREYYKRAYGLIAAAGCMNLGSIPGLVGDGEIQSVLKRASGTAVREFGSIKNRRDTVGKLTRRFLSAVTCRGYVSFDSTVDKLCPKVYALDNDLGLASVYIAVIADAAVKRGINGILCPDPIDPLKNEALLIPELGLAFISAAGRNDICRESVRHIRLDSIPDREKVRLLRSEIKSTSKLKAQLLGESVAALSKAKTLHDELEDIYNPYVDFDGVYALAQRHIVNLLK